MKCARGQEFVIGGFTEPRGARSWFGALLLGVNDENGALRYAGRVGTGFSEESLPSIRIVSGSGGAGRATARFRYPN